MNIRNPIVAAVVLLALLGTLYWSGHRKPSDENATKSADTSPTILKLDENTITRIEFKKKDEAPVVLAKNAGSWEIAEPKRFAADQSTVTSTVTSLASLNSERLVDDHAVDLKQYGLEQPGLEIDVTEKNSKSQKLLVGDATPTGSAVYAKLAGDSRVYTIATYNKTSIDKGVNDLRDKRLLTMDANKISRVELLRKNQVIEFGRNKEDWQILQPRPLRADNFQVAELVRKLADARMNLSGTDKDAQEAAAAFVHGTPVATAKVTDPGSTQELQIRKNKDTYYAKSSTIEGTYKVDGDLGQAVDKGLDDFREKKIFDFGFNDPSKIEMHNGPKAYFLTRNGVDWWSNGKKMDAPSVQEFVTKLRDLTATKFVDSGFSNPTIQVVVTSDDGKHTDTVSIAKSGDGYIARRENDASLYYFDSSAFDGLQKAADDIKPFVAMAK
jgi:Domain of unknown function (DUF4340)